MSSPLLERRDVAGVVGTAPEQADDAGGVSGGE
jgi:hypothetical protein